MFLRFQICSSIFNSKYQSLERSPIDFAVFGFMSELNKYYTRDRPQISARWTHFLCLTNVSIFFSKFENFLKSVFPIFEINHCRMTANFFCGTIWDLNKNTTRDKKFNSIQNTGQNWCDYLVW